MRDISQAEPKWTVLYNLKTSRSDWIGTAWEFFDDEPSAELRFRELKDAELYPTKRPYYRSCDEEHLAAGHLMSRLTKKAKADG